MTSVGNDLIKQLFDFLQQFNYNLKIEGHTHNSPIRIEQFPSNWELSAARAAEVARELVEAGSSPTQLSVEGFAQYRPKVPNYIFQARATNRRIEIVYQRGSVRKNIWWMSSAAIVDRSLRIYSPGIL